MTDMELWLQGLGLEKYVEVFSSHDVDLTVAPDLTEQDLQTLGVSLGHRRKFIAAAAKLRAMSASPAIGRAQTRSSDNEELQIERRQVTVVFTDLVGSTALATRLDPEDLSRLLRNYRDVCTGVIGKYDGFIAQYLGDGVLAYFGYPQAQEQAAERAIRAGLEIVKEMGRLAGPDGLPLQTRIGIATGLVVAGGTSDSSTGKEQTVVGDTPNLAARLQALAEPGYVFVSPATRQLTGKFFEYAFVGEHEVKGFSRPIPVWKVLHERAIESRFAASRTAAAGPIVARDRELAFLLDAWQRAAEGNGHIVLVSGEAGMGKSRLIESLAERVKGETHRLLRCQCSPYHRFSALYPFTQLLRHTAEIKPDQSAEHNLQRIEQILTRFGRFSRLSLLLLAELLDVPAVDALSPMEMTLAQRKTETLAILEDFVMVPIEGAPVMLLLEDAHWSDPTTQALVMRLLGRIERERALVLITHRPEFKTKWGEHPSATTISCKQLGRDDCVAMIRLLAGKRPIHDSLVQEIVTRSDGVPLYVEELTKAVLDMHAERSATVPATLQDSLMARLDRMGRAKDIAQIASVIGRQFSYPLLSAIAGASDEELRVALERLQDSGLIFATGEADEVGFRFNHSLVQEAAYESLSRAGRQNLHDKIARLLETQTVASRESEPVLIAHHFSRAGKPEKSCYFWMVAADRSAQQSAFAESIANLNSALAEAERIADGAERSRCKLEVQLKLGATFIIQSGPQSSEAAGALVDAYELAKKVGAGKQTFQAAWGLYLNAASNRRFDKAHLRGEELIAISEELADDDLHLEAVHHRWGFAYFTGQTARILDFTQEGLNRYDPERHHRLSGVFAGHDLGVCAHGCHSTGMGLIGRPEYAKSHSEASVALAESLQHPVSLAFSLGFASQNMHAAGDFDACREFADRLVQVASKYEFQLQRSFGSFMRGAVTAQQEDLASGLGRMESEFETTLKYGFPGVYAGVVMADALARTDRTKDALAVVMRMLDVSGSQEKGIYVSELWRLRGELTLKESASNTELAERFFQTSVRIASEQGAKVYLLRASIALARLLAELGRRNEAMLVLAQARAGSGDMQHVPEVETATRLCSELG